MKNSVLCYLEETAVKFRTNLQFQMVNFLLHFLSGDSVHCVWQMQ